MFSMLTLCIKHIPNNNQDYGIDTDLVSIPRYYILVSYRNQNYGIEPSLYPNDFWHKIKMYNFDPYNVLLSIATNMTAFVLQGHV